MAFNCAQWAVAQAVAGWVFVSLGGVCGATVGVSDLLPLAAAGIAHVFTNLFILVFLLAIQNNQSPQEVWQKSFRWAVPVSVIGNVLGGGALALAFGLMGMVGVYIFLFPILSSWFSFRVYSSNSRKHVDDLENINLSLDETNHSLLETFGAIIDAYDVYTYGHSTQVAVYAKALAEKMGLPREEREDIFKAALIHDIGKIGIPETILSKPGKLSEEEYKIMCMHPAIGARIVRRMKGMEHLVPLIFYHHERWDGTGYPAGLSGWQIPLGARIIAVADSVEAMRSDRIYHKAKTMQQIRLELSACAGGQFDPRVVSAFLKIEEEKGEDFFRNVARDLKEKMPENDLYFAGKYLKAEGSISFD